MISDLSLDIIKFNITPYLLPKQNCLYHNKDFIKNYLNLKGSSKFYYKNLPPLNFHCLNRACIFFENNIWCSFHDNDEFELSVAITKEIRRNHTERLINELTFFNSNQYCVHPENFNSDSIYIFKKICPKERYRISHLCCGGKGICFNLK